MKAQKLLNLLSEEVTGNWFAFGEFGVALPVDNDDAEKGSHSLGASGAEAYIEQVRAEEKYAKQPNLFKDAARELHFGLPKAKKWMEDKGIEAKYVDMYIADLEEMLHWFEKGYRKQFKWDHSKKMWSFMGY